MRSTTHSRNWKMVELPHINCGTEFHENGRKIYVKGLGGYLLMTLQKILIKRPVSLMERKVNSRIFLFKSLERSWSPYNNSCVKESFERSLKCMNGRINSAIPAKRFRRWASKEGQSNKKCSVSSMPFC